MSEDEKYQQLYAELSENGDLVYVGKLLARAALLFPQKIAVMVSESNKLTYHELYAAASAISKHLEQKNIKPGDRVVLLYENSINFYIAYFGILQTGAIVVPVNTFLHEKELTHIIADATPKIIFVSDSLAPKLATISQLPPLINQQELTDISSKPTTFTPYIRNNDELAIILYTSGTTGVPKGVMLSSRNVITNVIQGGARFKMSEHERLYCVLPLFHSFTQNTCVWASTALGATVIIIPKMSRQHLIEGFALRPTVMLGVPGLYALFCRFKTLDFSSVRYLICGGDALTDTIRKYVELIYGRKLCNGYGLSETSPFIAVNFDDVVTPTNNIGKPCVGVELQIRDGAPIGVLWVKGPNIMLGYYNAPEATAHVLVDGWFNTGDLARLDAQGNIIICGREKDLIVHKGIKIYPQEVENIIATHPAVMMCAVIGDTSPDGDEFPVAYVSLKEPVDHAEQLLTEYCKQHLAPYKVPRKFIILSTLPLTGTGKIDKKELKKTAAQ